MKIKEFLTQTLKKKEIEIVASENGQTEKIEVYLRPMPFRYVYPYEEDGKEVSGLSLTAKRIAHCVVDESGVPIFEEAHILGVNDVAIPPLIIESLNDLVIRENGLGKIYESLVEKMNSGASSSSTELAEEQ